MSESGARPPDGAAAKPKVLLADDDEDQRFLMGRLLQRAGFEALLAGRGEDVMTMAREARPDVIVLDVQMPGQDGFTTCRQLKADAALAAVPIIFLSGRMDESDRSAAIELGAEDFLAKSSDPRDLLQRVQQLARR